MALGCQTARISAYKNFVDIILKPAIENEPYILKTDTSDINILLNMPADTYPKQSQITQPMNERHLL